MKRHARSTISTIAFLCLAGLFFPIPQGFGQSEHTAKLIDGAKKEGKFVWYTSMSLSDAKLLLDGFKKAYPFADAELFRMGGETALNRLLTETRAGKWNFDVVAISGMGILIHHKLISRYSSPEAATYHQEFKNSEGYWTGIFNNYYVVGYNTKHVSEREAPRRWEDLLDQKWKGKISMDQEEYPWYATLLMAWGKERAERYMKALAKQDIQWRKGHTLIAQLVAAGEFPIGIVYVHTVESMKKNGAPIEWLNTLDPIVVSVNGAALSAKPNNPNTAKLFIDFALSKEGQTLVRSLSRIPARSDVEPLSPKMDQTRLKLKAVPDDMGVRYREYVDQFRQIFGLQ